MNRRVAYFLSALLAAMSILAYWVAEPFLGPGIFAALVAIAFRPVFVKLSARTGRPGAAALVTTLLAFCLILLPLGFIVKTISGEVTGYYQELKSMSAASGGIRAFTLERADLAVNWVASRVGLEPPDVTGMMRDGAEALSEWLVRGVTKVAAGVGIALINAFLSAVVLFFFLRDADQIREAIYDILPLNRADCDELGGVIANTVKANFYGLLGVASAQGLLTGIGWAVAGLNSPFTWGAIAAIASMIPVVGPAMVWAPGALSLAAAESYGMAVFLAAWGVIVVGMADNILRPVLVMGQTKQHPLLVFLALIGGANAFGLMGLFLGPLIVSVLIAVIGLLRREMAEMGN